MTPSPRKEFCSSAALTFGLLFFGALQMATFFLIQEDVITFWLARKERFMPPRPIVEEKAPEPVPEPDRTRPLAVMVDDHPAARPQSGLARADDVWEVLVEGGLTRYMLIFRSSAAEEIGPVRSARPYFLSLSRGYDAAYVHVGGSDEALAELASGKLGLDDINEFRFGGSFRRDGSRLAPHNTYTSSERLRELIRERGWEETTEAVDASLRSDVVPDGKTAKRLTVKHATGGEPTEFAYVPETGSYALMRDGEPAADRDGTKVAPRTIVALELKGYKVKDPQGKGLIGLETLGTGKATVARDGVAFEGTWKKTSAASPLEVFDGDGKKAVFARGQVWYSVVVPERGGEVTYR